MPTCPGCQQRVSHDRLDTHERYCPGLRNADRDERRRIERLEERIESLDRRLDGRVRALEMTVGNSSPGEGKGDITVLERDW